MASIFSSRWWFGPSSFLGKLLGGKKSSAPAAPAGPVQMRPIAVWTVKTAHVKLTAGTTLFEGDVNEDGYILFNVPAAATTASLAITAKGYNDYSQSNVALPPGNHDLLVFGSAPTDVKDYQIVLPNITSPHFDPSTLSLRDLSRIRGAMWTVPGPWRFGPRPGQPTNITAMEYIYSYGDPNDASNLNDEQKAMIAKYKSFGYTHVAFGPINAQSYHGQYPDTNFTSPEMFEKWLDWLQMFWDNGLAPICFLHPDGGTVDSTKAMYDHLIRGNERAQRLMRIVVPTGWEPTKYDWSSQTWAEYCKWAADVLPNALILIHTVADTDAPVGTDALFDDNDKAKNPDGNAGGWARVTPHIHGWLIQSAAFEKADEHGDPNNPNNTNFDNWANLFDKTVHGSYYDRFHNGYAGWPRNSKWGNEPIKIYAGEYCSYWVYWQGRTYEEGCKWGDRAIRVGADGYLDGGTVAVP